MKITNQKTIAPERSSGPIGLTETDPGDSTYQEPIIVAVYGDEGTGKSTIIGTAPGKIGVIPLERKTRASVLKAAAENDKTVVMPDIDLIRTGNPMLIANLDPACIVEEKNGNTAARAAKLMQEKSREIGLDDEQPDCCQQHYYRWHVNRVKSVGFRMGERDDILSIGMDFGQFIEDCLYANYGRIDSIVPRERKSLNQEVKDFLNAINHKNLILCHHSSQVYKDDKPTKHTKPASGFSKIGHYLTMVVEMKRDNAIEFGSGVSGGPDVQEPGRYTAIVKDCTANAACIGDMLVDEDISFSRLGYLVYPDTWSD